ncbi:hypothetical protein CYJ40_03010 [Brevibacterium ravenspurgense]|uniref:Uncharacterized protein n=1 Tax=Brevibacterium ravenspurgense TaxID=479117 RepID=A0A2I1IIS9_9MICO|nr:hypothetical protein CYJ40_03010 [Brevibacterium ravenspurgense]
MGHEEQEQAAGSASSLQAVVYVRISDDPEGTERGVERQEAGCRVYATARGWEVAGVAVTGMWWSTWRGVTRSAGRQIRPVRARGTVPRARRLRRWNSHETTKTSCVDVCVCDRSGGVRSGHGRASACRRSERSRR